MRLRRLLPITTALVIAAILGAADRSMAEDYEPTGPTPPRLALVEGDGSYWRPGAEDWVPAQLNTPLSDGGFFEYANR